MAFYKSTHDMNTVNCLLVFFGLLLFSCNNKREEKHFLPESKEEIKKDDGPMAGGVCSYDRKAYPATLIRLNPVDSIKFDAVFVIHTPTEAVYRDTLRYFQLTGNFLHKEQIIKEGIAVGKMYAYTEQTIVSGSCTPFIKLLTLKVYNPAQN
jgi:hypothetical protein